MAIDKAVGLGGMAIYKAVGLGGNAMGGAMELDWSMAIVLDVFR